MKPIFFAILVMTATVGAQTPPTNAPRTRLISPELHADRSVTFRLQAPNVTNVTVNGEWSTNTTVMGKGTNGLWTTTVPSLRPGIYGYSFTVDGVQMLDTANPQMKPMRTPRTSILDVPADHVQPHDFDPGIAHGTVRQHTYYSKPLETKRNLRVYTPPGYEQKRFSKFPVLYLFHGSGDNEATWTDFGRAQFIADNLIAQKKARPMIIVMTDGHALLTTGTNMFLKAIQAFESDLLGVVMPFVEQSYRVKRGPDHRAIAGLSMGGGQSLTIGLNHVDTFAWIGGFSSAVPEAEKTLALPLANPDRTNRQLKLLWVACGKDDFLIDRNKTFDETLTKHGIRHTYRITEGNHSWPVWRRYLNELLPLLF